MKAFAPIILRIGLSLVFLWFGFEQVINTSMWTSLIPDWITAISGISSVSLVYFNGAFEIVFGLFLLVGFFTRATALLLALHMFHITLTVGYSSIGVRDFGLTMAAFSIFFYGVDSWCLDSFWQKNK